MGEPQGVLVEVKAKRVGGYDDRKGMLAVGAPADDGGPSRRQEACAREEETRAFYSGRRLGAHEGHSSRGVGTGMGAACYAYGGLRLAGRRKVGAAWPRRARYVEQGNRAGKAVRRGRPHDTQTSGW
jgi:hypothetical protein